MGIKQWEANLKIPFDKETCIFSKEGELIFSACSRVVVGSRGPYVEALLHSVVLDNLFIPKDCRYRIHSSLVYYLEFRTKVSGIMV